MLSIDGYLYVGDLCILCLFLHMAVESNFYLFILQGPENDSPGSDASSDGAEGMDTDGDEDYNEQVCCYQTKI